VEIDNTDAEGRVILGDALAYAGEAARPADGLRHAHRRRARRARPGPAGAVRNDERDRQADTSPRGARARPAVAAAAVAAVRALPQEHVADMANGSASRMAGALSAALYLERFVPDGQRWAHVDVYAWNDTTARASRPAARRRGCARAFALLQSRYDDTGEVDFRHLAAPVATRTLPPRPP
jgi:leucyl aminopeptidase